MLESKPKDKDSLQSKVFFHKIVLASVSLLLNLLSSLQPLCGIYSGQIILETRYVKCKSSPKIPEIQWITLQPNPYFCSTNIPTSFDSQFWTSIDSFSVPFASHCATRRRYSPVQISFLPCPVGRLKWPQSNHHPLKPSKDDWASPKRLPRKHKFTP